MSSLLCAVCFNAKDDASNTAFMVMTAFMTLLPLALLGGAIYWIVTRIRATEAQDAADREALRSARVDSGEPATAPPS